MLEFLAPIPFLTRTDELEPGSKYKNKSPMLLVEGGKRKLTHTPPCQKPLVWVSTRSKNLLHLPWREPYT
jgi:hypothetical protein